MLIRRIILIAFLNAQFVLNAQNDFLSNTYLYVGGSYGRVIPEYQLFNYLIIQPTSGIELSYCKRTTGKSYWEKIYNYPEVGFTFQYNSLGNPEVFGNEFAFYPFCQFTPLRRTNFQLYQQYGLGLGYSTKRFDLSENFENVAVGSHLNIHFNFKLGTRFKLGQKLVLNAGVAFLHYSNANMAEPNIGMNSVSLFTGFNMPTGLQDELIDTPIPDHEHQNEFAFVYAAGGKHTRALQQTIYFTSSVSAEYKRHWKRKFHPGAGFDLFFDSSTKTEMTINPDSNYDPSDNFRTGIHLSQEIVYDHISFILQEGFYVGLTDKVNFKTMYNRGIVRWKINDNFLVHVSMKSHLHILDYPEFGFGYYFTRKNEK